jgi:hypothetical protein
MTHTIRFFTIAGILVTAALAGTFASGDESSTEVKPAIMLTDAEKAAVKDFDKRTKEYAAMHKKLDATLPVLPEKATPEQIDKHQKSMVALILKERKDAKAGEFFTSNMVALITRASKASTDGADKETKQVILEENPVTLFPKLTVNDRWPETAPVASMPVELLETLPELPDGQEYRFLGKRLVLLDSCCQLVLDITPTVLS